MDRQETEYIWYWRVSVKNEFVELFSDFSTPAGDRIKFSLLRHLLKNTTRSAYDIVYDALTHDPCTTHTGKACRTLL